MIIFSRVGNVTIHFGAHNIPPTNDPNVVSVSSNDILIHPEWYPPTLLHDVALVRFSEPIEFNGM